MRFLSLVFVLMFSQSLLAAAVSTKVLIPKDVAGCELDTADTVNHIHGKPLTPVGEITTGDCFDGWTSSVDFSYSWEAVRLGKVAKTCDKKTIIQSPVDLDPGRKGFLENFVAIGDCTHDSVVYTKYTADRDQ